MYRKNVAGQYLYFALINASTGAALTGATVTGKRAIDGAAQGSVTGTITEEAGGQYKIALSQADINGNNIGFLFTATSAIPVSISVVTTAADPTDSVRFGLTALPNAAAEAAGGLYTRGTGAGQIAQQANGQIDANVSTIKTQAVTCAAGVTVLASVGTAATSTAQTGDSFARIGAAGVGLTAVSLSAAGIQAIWDALTSALTTVGSIGKLLVDNINATISSRSTYAGGAVASVTAGVTVSTNNDKTGYALTAAYDLAKTAAQAGDAMALTSGERNSTADALLDRTAGVETSWTVRQAMRIILSALGGKLAGAATSTVTVRDMADSKNRISATVDASGNRTAVTLDAS